jgi:hypothetical protein
MKKAMAILLVLLVAIPLAVVAIAGCSSNPTPAEAKQQLNTDLDNLKSSLSAFTNPATYSSKDSVQKAIDQVQTDIDAVVNSAKEVKDVSSSKLSSAWDKLKSSVNDTLNSSESISQKVDSIQTALTDFQQAWQQLVDDLKTK